MSDDYFFDDDIVLDEDALAILDAEESKYFGTLTNVQPNPRPAPTQPSPPPAKRLRTDDDGGWVNHRTTTGGSSGSNKLVSQNQKKSDSFYEDLPNISLAGDGEYGVHSQGSQPLQNSNLAKNALGQKPHWSVGFQQSTPVPAPATSERTSSFNQNRPPPPPRLPPQRTLTPPANVPLNSNNSNRPQQSKQQQPPNLQQQTRGQIPRAGPGTGRNLSLPRQQPQHETRQFAPAQPVPSRPANVGGDAADKELQGEVARLRAQLELVRGLGTTVFRAYRSVLSLFADIDEHPTRVDAEGPQGGTGRKVPKSGRS